MKHKPEKQAAKLRKFAALYQDSPRMAQKVEQARRELVGLERLARWIKSSGAR